MVKPITKNGEVAQATGFFYQAMVNGSLEQFIITNKHVIRNAHEISLELPLAGISAEMPSNRYMGCTFKDIESIVSHPNSEVDLCAIPASKIFKLAQKKKWKLAATFFESSDLLVGKFANDVDVIEDIYMAGFPGGFGDNYHNTPLISKGTTATDFKINFNGKKDFVANLTGWNGSSGSPVMMTKKTRRYEKNETIEESRLVLAGVMYVCLDHIRILKVAKDKVYTTLPSNLLVILKAERIKELESRIKKQASLQAVAA